jgi:hypothetical protein
MIYRAKKLDKKKWVVQNRLTRRKVGEPYQTQAEARQ